MLDVLHQNMLEQQVLQALRERVFDNQGMLRPTQLQGIAEELAQLADPDCPALVNVGQRLNQLGLAFSSLQHAGTALLRTLLANQAIEHVPLVNERLMQIMREYHDADLKRVRQEQHQIQEAVRQAVAERQQQTERLEAMLHDLSTPIVPVYEGIIVVPLMGAIDSHRSREITTRLLAHISQIQASTVIIDITGVPVVDTSVAQHLLQTAQAVNLLGAEALLVGINPQIAQTMVQLGVDLGSMATLSDLQRGIAYALQRRGLGILPRQQPMVAVPA